MAKRNIFVVEDDYDLSQLICQHLERAGFAATVFSNGRFVVEETERLRPAALVLDAMIPGKDGFEICRSIRRIPSLAVTPVILVAPKGAESERIRGLELGADDYLSKPFSPRELVARIRTVLRRFDLSPMADPVRVGEIEIDCSAMTITVRGREREVTATEFRMLNHFATHAGRTYSRNQILDSVWREGALVTLRSVDAYVRRLRGKIERDPQNPDYLKTVRGIGYRFDVAKMLATGTEGDAQR